MRRWHGWLWSCVLISCSADPSAAPDPRATSEALTLRFSQRVLAGMPRERDTFGSSIAFSAGGERMIVGIPNSRMFGRAAVFVRDSGSWRLERIFEAPAMMRAADDLFGTSVAISGAGDVVVIGAPGPGAGSGAVYVSLRSGSTWSDPAILEARTLGVRRDSLGTSVAISGNGQRIAVGAPGAGPRALSPGEVQVYDRPEGGWSGRAMPRTLDGFADLSFGGTSLAISETGDRLLVGAPREDMDRGEVHVFVEQTGTGMLTREGVLRDSPREAGSYFGRVLALNANGTVAIVGAPSGASGRGRILAFERTGSSWRIVSERTGAMGEEFLGTSVAINGAGTLAFASFWRPSMGTSIGHVEVWNPRAPVSYPTLVDPTMMDSDFGFAVAISADGTRGAVGANTYEIPGMTPIGNAGAVYAYDLVRDRGEACTQSVQCGSGFCVDGVCCETACESAAGVCRACSRDRGASVDGTCVALPICTSDGGMMADANVVAPDSGIQQTEDGGRLDMPAPSGGCGCRVAGPVGNTSTTFAWILLGSIPFLGRALCRRPHRCGATCR